MAFVTVSIDEDVITVSFDAGEDKIMELGSKMNEVCDEAYMNGYNWDAFINCYLEVNAPELLDVIESDPEAEMYCAYIEDTSDEGKEAASKLEALIESLLGDEAAVMSFLSENASDIEWD